jgi:NAD(P)H-hydrate epimerase
VALSAHVTLAIGCPKWGHYLAEGPAHRGKLIIIDGGFPISLLEGKDEGLIPKKMALAPQIRKAFEHKNDFGHVLVVGGSPGLSGAPLLCAQAAQAMGVGLLTLLTSPEAYKELCWRSHDLLSIMLMKDRRKALSSFSAIAVGPGLGRSPHSEKILREILEELETLENRGDSEKKLALILDADALNILARNKALLEVFANCKNTFKLITPHVGEMASLLGMTDCKNEILTQEGLSKVKEFARRNECFVLLKNAISFLCGPDEKVFVLDAPNSGLAKGGSGDVLCGMILGLMGLKVKTTPENFVEDCVEGMLFHSRMGKIVKNKWGEQVMQPQDLVTNN